MTPAVSVLIPVLRPQPDYLKLALSSILRQSWADFELLVVEAQDDSPAGAVCPRVLQDLGDDRIRHLLHPRANIVDQLNAGLGAARGEFIARMDADDWSHPERFAEQIRYLREHSHVAVVGTQIDIMDHLDRPLGHRCYPTQPGDVAAALRRYNALAHPSVMLRREVVTGLGGYRCRQFPSEDYELWCRLVHQGFHLANLPRPLLRYRVHPGGVKAQRLRGILRGTRHVKRCYYDKMCWRDQGRYWAEGMLLALPGPLVLRLFQRWQYVRH